MGWFDGWFGKKRSVAPRFQLLPAPPAGVLWEDVQDPTIEALVAQLEGQGEAQLPKESVERGYVVARLANRSGEARWLERWAERPVTRFERKGLDVGRDIADFCYRRTT